MGLLQHGLMLTWETARGRAKLGERVRLDRGVVENAAGLAELLSSRTDSVKAAAATDERLARVVEAVFRALTDVGARKFAVRRPCAFRDLCAIAGTTPEGSSCRGCLPRSAGFFP